MPYIAVGKLYFSLSRGLLRLLFITAIRYDAIRLNQLGGGRRVPLALLKRWSMRWLGRRINTIALSADADLAIRVHRGYKLFDFAAARVIKSFDEEVDDAVVAAEIEAVKRASSLSFAPTVVDVERRSRLYQETFIAGTLAYATPAGRRGTFIRKNRARIIECLVELSRLEPARKVSMKSHVSVLCDTLALAAIRNTGVGAEAEQKIVVFFEEYASGLKDPERTLPLVLSHGDFSLVNIIETQYNLCVIDWEGAAFRSILFDLFNCYLTELYYDRVKYDLVAELNHAVAIFCRRLGVDDMLRPADHAIRVCELRKVYYLERIFMLLERELSTSRLNVVLRSIDVFRLYDQMEKDSYLRRST